MAALERNKKILELWRDPKFSGAYAGLATFQTCLEHEKNISISRNELLKILRTDRDYVLEMRKIPKAIKRRPMNIHGVGILWQADLGQLFEHDGYTGFLLCIDIYSRRIFCEKLKTKTKRDVEEAFKNIFKQASLCPEKLETDMGAEFQSNRSFFEKKNIYLKVKTGANKAR